MLWHPPNIGNLLQHLADVYDDSKETATETPVHFREVLAAVFINVPLSEGFHCEPNEMMSDPPNH